MAWQLTIDVRDNAPRLSLGERAVLLAIAEQVRMGDVHTRRTPPLSNSDLAKFSGLTASGLRAALRRLRDRGLEVRVPLDGRVGKDGRPMFAVPGVLGTYELPVFDRGLSALLGTPPADGCSGLAEPGEAADGAHSGTDDAAPGDGTTTADAAPADSTAEQLVEGVDDLLTSDDKGGTTCPPTNDKGGTGCPDRGARDDGLRGARDARPSRPGVPVRGGARVREAGTGPAVDAGTPAPAIAAELDRIGTVAPRCIQHGDLPADARVPSCPECASLGRAHRSRRSEVVREEARRRRRCTSCDELGWLLDTDGRTLVAPARRCTHTTVPAPTRANTRESEGATR